MITDSAARALISRWWIHYDEAELEPIIEMLHPRIRIVARSDSGQAANEAQIASDVTGIDEVRAWWGEHRLNGSFPIRHHLTNFALVSTAGESGAFVGNTVHTKIGGHGGAVALVSTRITGEVHMLEGELRLSRIETILDKSPSQGFGTH